MESLVSAARISSSSSSFSPLSIFHPKRTSLIIRPFPLRFSSKNEEDRCDFRADTEDTSSVPFSKNHACPRLPKNEAIDLVLSAAVGKGWVTGSGMEGPASPESDSIVDRPVSTFPWSLFTKSPRRRMRVSFTCNVCGQRTTRAINPHAYTDGTVFVQCCGCNVFHKLVDNLNLFHEMKCYVNPSFWYQKGKLNLNFLDEGVDDDDDDVGNVFPLV